MHFIKRTAYSEDEMIPLSGIQHFLFCPRQWALIHLEQLWEDNGLTAEGSLQHVNIDNPKTRETNGSNIITLRGLRISSCSLGLSGIADAVEIIPLPGAPLQKEELIRSRLFDILPVEYKHGRIKSNDCDRMQVVAQAMMLEDMFGISIKEGAIFYWQTRRREYFDITSVFREQVVNCVAEMHYLLKNGITPAPSETSACRSCSLVDICMPSIGHLNASSYIKKYLDEETP